ncbi:hypothetical protein [Spiroplasma alleghenense]|uniref:Uncharacterized protein n=1 Tax=Spiroplasma alleghenense TaxID=216931 RepID=A0A345Z2F2_9MOLU|nr:hypothetical protein [Spiroplasma alleghenense]AXK50781.1 hypothetical protein SALLE_v1c01050 [Spiroplasma alleghenense]
MNEKIEIDFRKIKIIIGQEKGKPCVWVADGSATPVDVKSFINKMQPTTFDKTRYNKDIRKCLREYEIKMSKCSQEIEQELIKAHKIWEERLQKDREFYQARIDKLEKILIQNNLIKELD